MKEEKEQQQKKEQEQKQKQKKPSFSIFINMLKATYLSILCIKFLFFPLSFFTFIIIIIILFS